MSVPADILARITAMFAKMQARGITESMQIYAKASVLNGGTPVARQRTLVGTISSVHVVAGGGTEQQAQEGTRNSVIDQVYFINDGSGLLTDGNYKERWVILPLRDNAYRRITFCKLVGPYYWAQIEEGSTADMAGNVK